MFFRDSICTLINLKLVYWQSFPVKPLQLHWWHYTVSLPQQPWADFLIRERKRLLPLMEIASKVLWSKLRKKLQSESA